ncbi:transcriptional regulator [Gottschalkia acidurici 9a]|uniref:Transcriptional regulator n=1 Tax=Gottschalkia acidurici (strain ATCC 7906 / DSM 604 / BCRC 14475 / CIP 104303 / KCTC 5404 / NCIMB 10678 / 9a) TaxID=1128398 RepID=K0B229_GOTA9|nr:LCP family protein [Gottschalkia acidurici]AFS78980.1 transcriptional regulator [Gottschalkia acidurici 9a]
MVKFFKTFFVSLMIFSVIAGGGIFFTIQNKEYDQEIYTNIVEENEKKEDNKKEDITFLLMGVDAKDAKKSEGQRTDTMIICRYDSTTGKASMLSIPRDTKAKIKGKRFEEKINHAHAYGGPELALKTVNELLDTDINYYVMVNYNVVRDFVDTMGGVEIDVPMDMRYSDPVADPPLSINLKKGKQTLDGDKALQFLRFRKGYADQDLGRINAQQEFIKSASKELLNPKNIFKLPKVVDTFVNNVDTNIPTKVMLQYALDVKNLDTEKMESNTLPGEAKMVDDLWYFIADKEESSKIIKDMFSNHEVVNKSNDNKIK